MLMAEGGMIVHSRKCCMSIRIKERERAETMKDKDRGGGGEEEVLT